MKIWWADSWVRRQIYRKPEYVKTYYPNIKLQLDDTEFLSGGWKAGFGRYLTICSGSLLSINAAIAKKWFFEFAHAGIAEPQHIKGWGFANNDQVLLNNLTLR